MTKFGEGVGRRSVTVIIETYVDALGETEWIGDNVPCSRCDARLSKRTVWLRKGVGERKGDKGGFVEKK